MQQCLCAAAVFVCARNLSASLPAMAGITPTHHRDFRPGIHPSGLLVPSICLLHLHRTPPDEKPYATHFSGSLRIDAAAHSTSLPFRTSLRNIHFAAMDRFIEEHIAQLKSFALETTLRPVPFDPARRATKNSLHVEMLFVAAGRVELHIDSVKSRGNGGRQSSSET
jgi:hypothetical protein